MFHRKLTTEIQELAKSYPVVTILGPRQSGKTTLVRALFPDKPYINLEELDVRNLAQSDPRSFFEKIPNGAILDEIQQAPDLLSYIQVIVDEHDIKGEFILTGSHQLKLHHAVAQSLAGRTALLNLYPMSHEELIEAGFDVTVNELILNGGYPRIYKDQLNPTKAYRNYFQTYIERDLRELIHVKDLNQFQRFVRICAGRVGQILNLEGIGNDVGISSKTVKEWISMLEASFIVFRLYPYFENFGKRMIKSPKLYFTDVGLATYLLGIENGVQLSRDPLRGSLIENLVVSELLKARNNKGLDPQLYFYRDTKGNEVDVIFQKGHQLIPIEVKASKTFHKHQLKNLDYFCQLAPDRIEKAYLVYLGEQEQKIGSIDLVNFRRTSSIV